MYSNWNPVFPYALTKKEDTTEGKGIILWDIRVKIWDIRIKINLSQGE